MEDMAEDLLGAPPAADEAVSSTKVQMRRTGSSIRFQVRQRANLFHLLHSLEVLTGILPQTPVHLKTKSPKVKVPVASLAPAPLDLPTSSLISLVSSLRPSQPSQLARHQNHSHPVKPPIIFDWDDTLFPTWHVVQTVEDVLPMDDALRASLDKISDTVRELLTLAKSCGQVAIVTLSRRPWVANSASEYLPKLGIEALLKELRIPVIYSRECVKPYMMRSPDGAFEEGVCPLTMAKELAMKKVLKKLYGKNPWKNVLSIGDSVTERTAITELLWAHMGEDSRSCCKTLKMLQDPTIEQLQMELNIIKDCMTVLWVLAT